MLLVSFAADLVFDQRHFGGCRHLWLLLMVRVEFVVGTRGSAVIAANASSVGRI